ncbi:uncharacterized protein [Macrobrachium rosenbergii]|uniref:uncharacterized protein n=1 Tax=Macrobrachium rosenbergii TaxID=79674 RepID=UPI0034D3AF9A
MAPSTDSTWRPPATDTSWPPPSPEPAIHSPPPESSPWRPPTSPREVASSVVASVQYVTSSVRLLFTGCFQCQSLKGGCWRRQEEPDGAWFDCDKLQVEHPYCYVNPVALTDPAPSEDATTPNGTVLSQQPRAEPRSPSSLTPSAKSPAKCPTNLDVPKDIVANGVASDGVSAVKGDTVIYKNGRIRSSLVESFAAKLEADLRRIECDRQRAEGELLNVNDVRITADEDVISFPDYLCADVDFFKDGGTDIPYQYDGFNGNRRLEHEVWKPSELEDVFECYNMAAFYSYGASTQLGEKGGTKNKGEKFEEVFPPTFSNNNNNTIKVYRPAGESESPLPLKDEPTKENVTEIEICDRKREISEDELKEFIHSCVLAENVEEASLPPLIPAGVPNAVCDELIYYGSRSFNKLLIFNLVKSVMAECQEHYSHSMPLCANYPVHLVQNKILSVLQNDTNAYQLSTSGLQAFHNGSFMHPADSQYYLNQLIAERMVENAVMDELKKEMKEWKDVSREERELKEAISTDILHDLISDTASLFDEIVKRKFT